ncbi:MAG: hypothetical protein ACP5MB_11725, partial [bacterium]
VSSIYGYEASPSSGVITVNGRSVTQSITFTPLKTAVTRYKINFTESGLPPRTNWSMILNGTTLSSTNITITFSEPNGTYSYSVGSISGYSSSPSSGSLTVSGASQIVSIRFSQVRYRVTFTENGLPSGKWYVNITGMQSSGPIQSSQTSYSISLPNGSYSYSVSTGNKIYRPFYTDSFTVSGAPVS